MQKTALSTADVARLFNVTETTVKRWADEGALKCQKTPGGHRKFIIKYVVEFAERNNLEPLGTLSVPVSHERASRLQLAVLERDLDVLVREFVLRAIAPDELDLTHYLSYLYEHKIPLWQIFDDVVRGGMAAIGAQWEAGEVGVELEHRASYETLAALIQLQPRIHLKEPNGRMAVFACIGEETHELGLRCAANLFEAEGWHVHYLGGRLPHTALISALRNHHPDAVCVSVTRVEDVAEAGRCLREVALAAHDQGTTALLGGVAAREQGLHQRFFDVVATSAKDLADVLAEWDAIHTRPRE